MNYNYDSSSSSQSDGVLFNNHPLVTTTTTPFPCQIYPDDWNYQNCYSYYANGCYNTCQFVDLGDMEDFM